MNIPVENCSSCGACANICARGAITMQLDAEGFYRPVIDSTKCVQCGACEKVCPWNTAVENPNLGNVSPKTVAAYADWPLGTTAGVAESLQSWQKRFSMMVGLLSVLRNFLRPNLDISLLTTRRICASCADPSMSKQIPE